MKEQLSHILDQSVCLTRRQVAAYLEGRMEPEELHAAQVHIASCPLCSLAMDGFEAHTEEGLAALATLNTDFLKEHFDKSLPQIHLNSVAPAAVIRETRRRRRAGEHRALPFGRVAAAAALLLVAGCCWWLYQNAGKDAGPEGRELATVAPAAQVATTPAAPSPAAAQTARASGENAAVPAATPHNPVVQPAVVAAAPPPASAAPSAAPAPVPGSSVTGSADLAATATIAPGNRLAYSVSPAPETREYGNAFHPNQAQENFGVDGARKKEKVAAGRPVVVPSAAPAAGEAAVSLQPSLSKADQAIVSSQQAYRMQRSDAAPAAVPVQNMEAVRKVLADGKRDEAKRLLQAIVQQGGSEKREARKLLRKLNREDN